MNTLLARYNCGLVKFTGDDNALYERHLTFAQVIPVNVAHQLLAGIEAARNRYAGFFGSGWIALPFDPQQLTLI